MRTFIFILIIIFPLFSFAQVQDAWIYFTDKKDVVESIHNPSEILSQKTLDRRALHGIPVDFKDVPVNEEFIDSIRSLSNFLILSKSKWMNAIYVRGRQDSLYEILNLGFVDHIEFADRTLDSNSPIDSCEQTQEKYAIESQLRSDYGLGTNQISMVRIDYLHELGFRGEEMNLAFLDAGYPKLYELEAFEKMNTEGRIVDTFDFVSRTSNVRGTGSHGRITLSMTAAELDSGYVGTAPKANYHIYRTEYAPTENPVEEAWLVEGLERADSMGVDVINISLGYQDYDNPNYDNTYDFLDGYSAFSSRGVNIAFNKGMIVVVSAGNDGTSFKYVGAPGDAPGALTVGAVDAESNYASFSSVGPTVDGRIKPDIASQGKGAYFLKGTGEIISGNGTSLSAPIITGGISCLWQAFPDRTNIEIIHAVKNSGSQVLNPDNLLGFGIPDFEKAYHILSATSSNYNTDPTKEIVFPNPAEDFITIKSNLSKGSMVSVFHANGQLIYSVTSIGQVIQINISNWESGLYYGRIREENQIKAFKFVKF